MIYFRSECVRGVFVLFLTMFYNHLHLEDHEANVFSSGSGATVTSDPAPCCQDVKLKEELDGLKKNIANGTRTLVDIVLSCAKLGSPADHPNIQLF